MAAFCEEQGFQIVAQRNGNNGEARAQSEDWEESEEVPWYEERLLSLPALTEVQSVQVAHVLKCKHAGEREQQVEHRDEQVVQGEEAEEARLVGDGRH